MSVVRVEAQIDLRMLEVVDWAMPLDQARWAGCKQVGRALEAGALPQRLLEGTWHPSCCPKHYCALL